METITMFQADQKKLIVTQANQLAVASYSLTLDEKRVVLMLISLLRIEDKDFKVYRVSIQDLQKHLGLKRTEIYTKIKELAVSLMQRVVKIEKPNGGWIVTNWISSAEYKPQGENNLECSCIDLCFDPKMKPFLLELKSQFHSYMLSNVASLKSIYSIRFYEMFVSYRRLGKVSFEIIDLKKRLQVDKKYKRYDDFRKRVILHAQTELKAKTDICFNFTEERKGRKVHKLYFTICEQPIPNQPQKAEKPVFKLPKPQKNQQVLIPPTEEEKLNDVLLEKAVQLAIDNGIQKKAALRYIGYMPSKHALENIEEAIAAYMRSKKEDKDISSLIIYFLQHDVASETREKRAKEAQNKKKLKEIEKAKAKEQEGENKRIELGRERRKAAFKEYLKLEPKEKERIRSIIKSKANNFEREQIKDGGDETIFFQIKLVKEMNDKLSPELQESL